VTGPPDPPGAIAAVLVAQGSVDHHLLRLRRVNPEGTDPLLWDLGLRALGTQR
jgi:uncharacterized membrane protein